MHVSPSSSPEEEEEKLENIGEGFTINGRKLEKMKEEKLLKLVGLVYGMGVAQTRGLQKFTQTSRSQDGPK